jgi:hypothetical protein
MSFFDGAGNALSLPLTYVQSGTNTSASTITQTIAAGSTLVVLTQGNSTGATVVGSAQLTTTGNISGFTRDRASGLGVPTAHEWYRLGFKPAAKRTQALT